MATIYAPNDHQDIFINRTLDKLLEFSEGQLILGGDFNVPLIPSVDTSSSSSSVSWKWIAHYIHRAQLVDC